MLLIQYKGAMIFFNAFQLVTIMFITICKAKTYRGHSLIHATASNDAVLEFFMNLERFYNVTFWTKPSKLHKPVQFSISRVNLAELRRDTSDMDIGFQTVIRDLQSAFKKQTIKPYIRRQMESFSWDSYHSIDDIYGWITDLRVTNPKEVDVEIIGQTFENRNILLVKVLLDGRKGRPKVMVEGGCHAREWMSPAFVTYMINEIVNAKTSTNEELKNIANYYEWNFIPVLNPDGYDYSQNEDRLWRKNCRGGYGVDLNRNFGIAFGKHDSSSTDKNNAEYCGPNAFSEKETAALSAYVKDNSDNLEYYLAFHSFGQYFIIPFASSADHRDNYDEVKKIADKAARVSSTKHGIFYSTGTAFDTVGYLASGVSADWIKQSLNVSYVASIELPDQGEYGFAMPPSKILPTCKATMDMILTFLTPQHKSQHELRHGTAANGVMKSTHFGPDFFIFSLLFMWYIE